MAKRTKKKGESQLPPTVCKGCGVKFVPEDRRQHYHSEACREEFYQRTYYSRTTTKKICPNCGGSFETTKPGRQDYCEPACRKDAEKKRREGTLASMTAERLTLLGDRFATMEKDGFKCVYCGRGARDGVKLDVEYDGEGGLHTVCSLCIEGREFNRPAHNAEA